MLPITMPSFGLLMAILLRVHVIALAQRWTPIGVIGKLE
jgi:hypothetical protein